MTMVIFQRRLSPVTWTMFNGLFLIRFFFLAFLAELVSPMMELEEFKLAQSILQTYNTMVRPVNNHRDTTTVQLDMEFVNLIDMDEVNQIMTTSVILTETWQDHFLVWDPEKHNGIEFLTLPVGDLWKPDIVLYNNANDNLNNLIKDTRCVLTSDGNVTWKAPAILMSACEMNPMFFPFDIQNCKLKFGSWTYHGIQLNLTLNATVAGHDGFETNGEWDLLEIPVVRDVAFYNCCSEPYPTITYNVILKRRSLFYMFNLVLPCVIIASIVLQGFYLPSDAGEKVALTITILLSLTVFLLLVADTMPPTSDVLPYLSMYYAIIIVVVGLCVVFTIVIINIHHRGDSTKVPRWLHSLILIRLASILGLRNNISLSSRQMEVDVKENEIALAPPIGVLNPIFEGDDAIEDIMDGNEPNKAAHLRERRLHDSLIELYMDKICKNITSISKRQTMKGESNKCAQEWKELAMVLDRFLMLLFLALSALITVVILMLAAWHVKI